MGDEIVKGEMTMCCWEKFDKPGNTGIRLGCNANGSRKDYNSAGFDFIFQNGHYKLCFLPMISINKTHTLIQTNVVPTYNEWHFFEMNRKDDKLQTYVDGKYVSVDLTSDSNVFKYGDYFSLYNDQNIGKIAHTMIFNKRLFTTDHEIPTQEYYQYLINKYN